MSSIKEKLSAIFLTGFGKSIMYQSLPWLATRILRFVADTQLEAEETLCVSCSKRIGKFHHDRIMLIISPFDALMDDQIEEAARLNMDAVKAEDLQRGIQEIPKGPISCLISA